MPLTLEIFRQMVGNVAAFPTGQPLGLRSEPRVSAAANLAIVLVKGAAVGKVIRVKVRDISASGIGVEGPVAMRVGDEFAVRFEVADAEPVWVHYAVVRWQPIAADLFVAGGKFLSLIKMNAA